MTKPETPTQADAGAATVTSIRPLNMHEQELIFKALMLLAESDKRYREPAMSMLAQNMQNKLLWYCAERVQP